MAEVPLTEEADTPSTQHAYFTNQDNMDQYKNMTNNNPMRDF